MSLYNLIKIFRGKESVVMTDSKKKVEARRKQLLTSQRKGVGGNHGKQPIEYRVEPTEETDKFKKVGDDYKVGGGDATFPRLKKWDK